jgi:hypothetical protein
MKKKLKLQQLDIQSFVTLTNNEKNTAQGQVAMATADDPLECILISNATYTAIPVATATETVVTVTSAVTIVSAVSVLWVSALKDCGSKAICFQPPANPSLGCHTDLRPCTGGRMICD